MNNLHFFFQKLKYSTNFHMKNLKNLVVEKSLIFQVLKLIALQFPVKVKFLFMDKRWKSCSSWEIILNKYDKVLSCGDSRKLFHVFFYVALFVSVKMSEVQINSLKLLLLSLIGYEYWLFRREDGKALSCRGNSYTFFCNFNCQ